MTDDGWYETYKAVLQKACVKGSKWNYDDGLSTIAVMPSQHDGYITVTISTSSRMDNLRGYITYHNSILIPTIEIPFLVRALQELVQ